MLGTGVSDCVYVPDGAALSSHGSDYFCSHTSWGSISSTVRADDYNGCHRVGGSGATANDLRRLTLG